MEFSRITGVTQHAMKGASFAADKFWNWDQKDRGNLHIKVGLSYIFNIISDLIIFDQII